MDKGGFKKGAQINHSEEAIGFRESLYKRRKIPTQASVRVTYCLCEERSDVAIPEPRITHLTLYGDCFAGYRIALDSLGCRLWVLFHESLCERSKILTQAFLNRYSAWLRMVLGITHSEKGASPLFIIYNL
jgi:hypothetical protein